MKLQSIVNGVQIHTKISAKNKRTLEAISKKTSVRENVIFNTALTEGLKRLKTTARAATK